MAMVLLFIFCRTGILTVFDGWKGIRYNVSEPLRCECGQAGACRI